MKIITLGYPLKFIQTHPVNDKSCHLQSYVFKFFSNKTKLHYIVRAELQEKEFFAIKFYAKKDRGSDKKYFNVINKGDVAGILVTSAKVIPYLLNKFPNASFGFFGSRTIDLRSEKVESYMNNQRFRLYKYHIGSQTFQHYAYKNGSAYGLINKNHVDIERKEQEIRNMLTFNYPDLITINLN